MIKCLQTLLIVVLLGSLAACAPTTPQAPETVEKTTGQQTIKPQSLDTSSLTAAEVVAGPPLKIIYGEERLYAPGAVLPGAEGLSHLEVLASWLKSAPQSQWLVTVGAEEVAGGPDPQKLAEKRQELLSRFFARQGLDPAGWQWQVSFADPVQLAFEQPGTP